LQKNLYNCLLAERKSDRKEVVSVGIKGVTPEFRIKPGKEQFETPNYWGKVRIRKDSRRGDMYIDLLAGKKREELNTHIGINLDQKIRFVRSRGKLKSIRREIDSEKRGRLADDTLTFNQKSDKAKLTFKVVIDERTKTIDLQFSENPLSEIQ